MPDSLPDIKISSEILAFLPLFSGQSSVWLVYKGWLKSKEFLGKLVKIWKKLMDGELFLTMIKGY